MLMADDQGMPCSGETVLAKRQQTHRIQTKNCACRGIRRCGVCRDFVITDVLPANVIPDYRQTRPQLEFSPELHYCFRCRTACSERHLKLEDCLPQSVDGHDDKSVRIELMFLWEDFITEEEETFLLSEINARKWVESQSGRRKQDYGPKVNFKKQKINSRVFRGLPDYSEFLINRMKMIPGLDSFSCVELCNLEYVSEREAHIAPHTDDSWLWGERLVTLNLLSTSALTLTPVSWEGNGPIPSVKVEMPRRSLFMMMGDSRYIYNHAVESVDIADKRIAMTFRELSFEFLSGEKADVGEMLLNIANCFSGDVVS